MDEKRVHFLGPPRNFREHLPEISRNHSSSRLNLAGLSERTSEAERAAREDGDPRPAVETMTMLDQTYSSSSGIAKSRVKYATMESNMENNNAAKPGVPCVSLRSRFASEFKSPRSPLGEIKVGARQYSFTHSFRNANIPKAIRSAFLSLTFTDFHDDLSLLSAQRPGEDPEPHRDPKEGTRWRGFRPGNPVQGQGGLRHPR